MGTKSTQQTTNQYNPQQMAAMNQMTPAMSSAATGYMQNPFGNPFFQQQQQMGTRQAQGIGGTQMSNIGNNMATSGIGGGGAAPFQAEMMANQGRANSGLQAQLGFMNPTNNALQMQQNAMGLAAGFKPLQTGGTQTQTTGGLGTWLPQLLGGALGALNPVAGLMGGMKGLMGGGGGGAPGAGAAFQGGGAFGAPSPGYGGTGMPGQNFPSPFFGGGGGTPPMFGGGQGPQMNNLQYGY